MAKGSVTGSAENGPVYTVAFSPDGSTVATGDDNGHVSLSPVTGNIGTQSSWQVASAVNSVAFSPDGKTLAAGDWNGQVVLSPVAMGAQTTWNDDISVNSVAFSPDDKFVASGDDIGQVMLRNLAGRPDHRHRKRRGNRGGVQSGWPDGGDW